MANLKKREMIILGVMGVAVLLGGYTLFAPARTKQSGIETIARTEDLEALLNNLNASAAKNATSSRSDFIFARAQKEWTQDPFWESSSYKKWLLSKKPVGEKVEAVKKFDFIYTGYLEIGAKKLAIINDIERQEGEKLEVKDHVLKIATPSRVIIENTATGAQQSFLLRDESDVKGKKDPSAKAQK